MTDPPRRRIGRPPRPDGLDPVRGVRVPEERWQQFKEAAETACTDRSKAINEFAAWFTREPGAKLPKRPARTETPLETS